MGKLMTRGSILIFFMGLFMPAFIFAQQNGKVVVLPFAGTGVDESTLDLLTEFLWQELTIASSKEIKAPQAVKSALRAAGYADPACYDITCANNYGTILGARRAVIGQAAKAGQQYRLAVKVVDVVSKQEIFAALETGASENDLFTKLSNVSGPIADALKQPLDEVQPSSEVPKPQPLPAAIPSPQQKPSVTYRIFHQPPPEAESGRAIPLEARVLPNVGSNKLFLIYRPVGETRFRFTAMTPVVADQYYGEIPGNVSTSRGLEYYFRVVDSQGNELGRAPSGSEFFVVLPQTGKQEQMSQLPLPREDRPAEPEVKQGGGKKWLWIAAGTVALGGAAFFALQGGDGDEENGSGSQPLPMPPNRP